MKNLKIALTIILVLTFSFSTLAQDKAQNKKAKEQNKENKGKGGKPEDKGKPADQNEKSEDQDKKEKSKPEDQGGKPDDKGKARQDDKEKSDKGNDQKDKEDKEFKGQGNAYGRNKGGLSGREFGQLRSQEARAKVKKDLEDSDLELAEQERQIGSSKSKIEEGLENIKKEQEAKKTPDKKLEEKKSYYETVKEKILKKEEEVKAERSKIKEALNKLEKEEQQEQKN